MLKITDFNPGGDQRQEHNVPDEVLRGAHLVESNERERGQEPAEGQVLGIPERWYVEHISIIKPVQGYKNVRHLFNRPDCEHDDAQDLRHERAEPDQPVPELVALGQVEGQEVGREVVLQVNPVHMVEKVFIHELRAIGGEADAQQGQEAKDGQLKVNENITVDDFVT